MVQGLTDGADDDVVKPFDREELRGASRSALAWPHCKRLFPTAWNNYRGCCPFAPLQCVRDDDNYWHQVEVYLARHTDAQFSHGICPECFNDVMPSADHRPAR